MNPSDGIRERMAAVVDTSDAVLTYPRVPRPTSDDVIDSCEPPGVEI